MNSLIAGFEQYLVQDKGASENTVASYLRDLRGFLAQSGLHKKTELRKLNTEYFRKYFLRLAEEGKSPATLQRTRASLVCFYTYLMKDGAAGHNPVKAVPLTGRKQELPETLSTAEVDRLLQAKAGSGPDKEIRDRAMLELLYATGIKVSELISLDLYDANPALGYLRCRGARAERVLPLYPEAAQQLDQYIRKVRPFHLADSTEQALFLNASGSRLTRQGFWKIIKARAAAAHIEKEITPQLLRHSFAMHLLQNGADLATVQEILGHADISTTKAYAKRLQNDLKSRYTQFHPKAKK